MSSRATLKELRDRALDYADMTDSDFADTDRLNNYVNDGLAKLHDILVDSFEDYFRKVESITIVAGTETYDLPDDFYKVKKCYYLDSSRRFRVTRFNLDEIDGYRSSPLTGGSVELWYVPQFKKLENDDSEIEVALVTGWEDFVALHAAVRLGIKEETDVTELKNERADAYANIIKMCEPRDPGTPDCIADVSGRWDSGVNLLRIEDRYKYRILANKIHFIEAEIFGS